MQAYISTSRLVAFNIRPRQHYVTENQRIMRDEEETVYIAASSRKKKTSLGSLKEFLSAGNFTQAPKKNSLKNSPPYSLSTVSFFRIPFSFFSLLLYPRFTFPTISTAANSFCHLFLLHSFCSPLFCPILLQPQKARLIPYGH